MNNVDCKNCGKSISTLARTCPDCGHPQAWLAQPGGTTYGDVVKFLLVYPFSAALCIGFVGFLADRPRDQIIDVAAGLASLVFVFGGVALLVKSFLKRGERS